MIAKPEIHGIPAELLAWEASGFDGEEGGFGDAPTDFEWSPERFFVAEAVVGPIFPMVPWGDLGLGFVLDLFTLAEHRDSAIGLEQECAFFADDHGMIRAGFDWGKVERGEGR